MPDYTNNFLTSMTGYTPLDTGDPEPDPKYRDQYYEASAKLLHYKNILNEKLKNKNPEAFSDYFKNLMELRKSGKSDDASKYIQDAKYNEYLSPAEVRQTLGEKSYNDYLGSLQAVNAYNIQQGMQPLYGQIEGENDINNLNYGRRFASLQVTPSISIFNQTRGTSYNRTYQYNPASGNVDFTESGDMASRPSYLKPK